MLRKAGNGNARRYQVADRDIHRAFLAVGLLRLPNLIDLPHPTMDSSWMIGLQLASIHHFQLGRDVLFNYGPLHYIETSLLLVTKWWIFSFCCKLLIHLVLIVSCLWFVLRDKTSWLEGVIWEWSFTSLCPRSPLSMKCSCLPRHGCSS